MTPHDELLEILNRVSIVFCNYDMIQCWKLETLLSQKKKRACMTLAVTKGWRENKYVRRSENIFAFKAQISFQQHVSGVA